jgi:phosphoheptose isomerase
MIEGMLRQSTVQDTVTVVRAALRDGRWVYLLINNRSGSNAPLVAAEIIEHWDQDSFHD